MSQEKHHKPMQKGSILYSEPVLAFIQYAVKYCALLEPATTPRWERSTIVECQKYLAHIYTQACELPTLPSSPYHVLERLVKEEDYEIVKKRLEEVLGEYDRFLNAQMEEMKYSDLPVSVSSAELLSDIYQVLADTAWAFRSGNEQNMYQAIAEVKYSFVHEWGTLLLAVLRQLHDLLSSPHFHLSGGEEELEQDDWI